MKNIVVFYGSILAIIACSNSNFSGNGSKEDDPVTRSDKNSEAMGPSLQTEKNPNKNLKPQNRSENSMDSAQKSEPSSEILLTPRNDPAASVDLACSNGQYIIGSNQGPVIPLWSRLSKTAPADCRSGVELNNLKNQTFTLDALNDKGSRSIVLELDFASYSRVDRLKVIAKGSFGESTIFDSCRLRTSPYPDPTKGFSRPPEDSIRDFRVSLPAGTINLVFDMSEVPTATYLRVTGLCDFKLPPKAQSPVRAF